MVNKLFFVGVLGFVGLIGCSKASASGPGAEQRATTRASVQPRRATAPMAENPRDISALFQVEASNRPSGTLRAEDVLGAFRAAGLTLHEERQHLARPYGARYCVGAKSGAELALSVCEYIDQEAARAGAETSRKIPLANREIRLNRATSLTVRQLKKTTESDALAARLLEAFAKL